MVLKVIFLFLAYSANVHSQYFAREIPSYSAPIPKPPQDVYAATPVYREFIQHQPTSVTASRPNYNELSERKYVNPDVLPRYTNTDPPTNRFNGSPLPYVTYGNTQSHRDYNSPQIDTTPGYRGTSTGQIYPTPNPYRSFEHRPVQSPKLLGVAYSEAPNVSHMSFDGYGIKYSY